MSSSKSRIIPQFNSAVVIGAGSFGTSISEVLSSNFKKVILKVRHMDLYEQLKKGKNERYLPGKKIASNIVPALTWEEVSELSAGNVELLVSGIPSSAINGYFHDYYGIFKSYFEQGVPLVSLSKGIDPESLELPDDILGDIFPEHKDLFTFLSGPSFAQEIMDKQITLVSLAGRSRRDLIKISRMLQTDFFSVSQTYDVKGLLLGGALKNVLAIAGGIVEGLGYNHNTRAALITQGIYEMLRFGVVFNARPETFYGLSGMGDLILTTTGELSRNKLFGREVAKGRKVSEILSSSKTVVEGYKTTKAVQLIAEKYDIKCRIFNGVYQVLYKGADPKDVIFELMRISSKFYGMI